MAQQTNELKIVLSAQDQNLNKILGKANKALQKLSSTAEKQGARTANALDRMAARAQVAMQRMKASVMNLRSAFLVLAGAAVLKSVVKLSAEFEKSLANINTLLDGTGVSIKRFEEQLVEMSKASSKDILDLSKGLYQTISAGIPAIEGASGAMATLDAAQKAAVAGLSTTEDAVNGVVSVVNAYGAENISAAEASDKLLRTVQLGRTTFPELANAIGRVAPMAAKFGVSIDEVLGMLVMLTRQGINTNEAVTGLRSMIKGLAQPTGKTQKTIDNLNKSLAKGSKVAFGAAALEANGLMGQIKMLTEATGGSADMMSKLFPNVRAVLPALVAVGKGSEATAGFVRDLGNSAGTTEKAVAKVAPTFSETANIFKSQVQAVFIKSGTEVLPLLNKRIRELGDFLMQNEGTIVSFFRATINALDMLASAMKFLGGPILKVFAAVFAGKMIRSFANLILMEAIPALRSLGAMATTAMASVRTAMVTGMQQGATQMMTAFRATVDTSFKGNLGVGALKNLFARLPSMLGLVAIGMQLGEMLGDAIGKGMVAIFRSGAFEAAAQELEAQNQALLQSLWSKGFTGLKEFQELERGRQSGSLVQIGKDDVQQVNVKLKLNTELAPEETLDPLDRLLSAIQVKLTSPEGIDPTKPILEDIKLFSPGDRAKVERALNTYATRFKAWREAVNKQMASVGQPDAVEWKARAEARKAFVTDAKNALASVIGESDGVIKQRDKAATESTNRILQSLSTQKDRYVDFNAFLQKEEELRLAKGISAERAREEARAVTLALVEQQLNTNSQKRMKAIEEVKDFRKEYAKLYPEYARTAAVVRNFSVLEAEQNKQLVASYNRQRAKLEEINGRIKQGLKLANERLANERQNLLVLKGQLGTQRDINDARKAAAEKAEKDRKRQERIAKFRAAAAKRRAAQQAVAAALNQLERKGLDLQVRKLKFIEAELQLKLDLNKAAFDEATEQAEQVRLLQQRKKIITEIAAAQKTTAAARTGIKILEAEEGSRRAIRPVVDKGKLAKKSPEEIAETERKEAIRLEEEKAVIKREAANEDKKIEGQAARRRAAAQKQINAISIKAKKQEGDTQEEIDRKAEAALKKRIALYFAGDSRRQAQARRLAEETGKTEAEAQEEILKIQEEINGSSKILRDAYVDGKIAAESIRNTLTKAGAVVRSQIQLPMEAAAATIEGVVGLNFNELGASLTGIFVKAAKGLTGFLSIGLKDVFDVGIGAFSKGADNLINGTMFPAVNRWGAAAADMAGNAGSQLGDYLAESQIPLLSIPFAAGKAAGVGVSGEEMSGGIQKGFKAGVTLFAEGFALFAKGLVGAMKAVLDGFVKVFEKVLQSVLQPAMQALQAPVDTLLGGLGDAVGVLTQRPSDKEAEQRSQELEDRRALLNQEMASRVASAQSNEEVAAIQSEYADKLRDLRDEAGQTEDTPADKINKAIDDAIAMADAVLSQLPELIESFLMKLADAIPVIVPKLVDALARSLVAIARNLGPVIKNLITALMDSLPMIIDALVEAVPLIIEALLDGLILLIEKLPDFIITLIDGIVEMLPTLFEKLAEKLPDLIVALIEAVPEIITAIIVRLPSIIFALIKGVGLVIIKVIAAIPRMVWALVTGIFKGLAPLGKFFKDVGDYFAKKVTAAVDFFVRIFSRVGDFFRDLFSFDWFHGGGVIRQSTSGGVQKAWREMGVAGYQMGGMAGAIGSNFRASLNDNIPALLQAGEGVLNRQAMANLGGAAGLARLNRGEGGGGVTNVSVNLAPSAGAEGAIAEVLLPLLIGGVATQVTEGKGEMTTALDQRDYGPLGFRGVPGSK